MVQVISTDHAILTQTSCIGAISDDVSGAYRDWLEWDTVGQDYR